MTGREVIEHWKQHLQDYPTCSHLMVQRQQVDALIRAMEREESEETLQVMALLLQEARALARELFPTHTGSDALVIAWHGRMHEKYPWLKEES